jgi:hypothetical protein
MTCMNRRNSRNKVPAEKSTYTVFWFTFRENEYQLNNTNQMLF